MTPSAASTMPVRLWSGHDSGGPLPRAPWQPLFWQAPVHADTPQLPSHPVTRTDSGPPSPRDPFGKLQPGRLWRVHTLSLPC